MPLRAREEDENGREEHWERGAEVEVFWCCEPVVEADHRSRPAEKSVATSLRSEHVQETCVPLRTSRRFPVLATEVIRSKNDRCPLRGAFFRLLKSPMLLSVYIFILSYLAVIGGNAPNGRKV